MHLLKGKTRLRVKEVELPITDNKILGLGIEIASAPNGHMSCPHCKGFKWEVWTSISNVRIEVGCMGCGWNTRLLIPIDVEINRLGQGRFSCMKHPRKGMIIIKNDSCVCIGCELCKSQAILDLRTDKLILGVEQ